MTDLYAVIGNPISHSKSPQIHHAFAQQLGHDIHYTTRLILPNDLNKDLATMVDEGIAGFNVTVPFKEQVWQWVPQRSERATQAGAVNTVIVRENGQHLGDNTDGIGLCRDLIQNNGIGLTNKRILLLGAGGAAKGVILPLLQEQPESLTIANRTVSKAELLVEQFRTFGPINACPFETIKGSYDVIINATSASLSGEMPPIPSTVINEDTCCYDMMYGADDTVFIKWAKQHNAAKTIDGLGMLVEQAAEAFYLWRQARPDTQTVISQLR